MTNAIGGFGPVHSTQVFTMPQYLKMRFGGERIRVYLTCLALILSIFTKISVDLYSGAVFLQQALNWNLYASVIALILLAAFFTVGGKCSFACRIDRLIDLSGGLTAVIWTDFIQTVIMIVSAFILMIISEWAMDVSMPIDFRSISGFVRIGGLEQVRLLFPYAVANTTLRNTTNCGIPSEDYFSLIRPFDADLPWFGLLFGSAVVSVWYWSCDQVIVQRTLAAKNITHARAGCLFAGLLKFLPLFLMIFPGQSFCSILLTRHERFISGMVARILFPGQDMHEW
jgi:uncharacterized sodium:solute symporter family permease YidK